MRSSPPESTFRRRSFIAGAGAALAGLLAGLPFIRTKSLSPSPEGGTKTTTVTPHRHAVPRIQKSENQNG